MYFVNNSRENHWKTRVHSLATVNGTVCTLAILGQVIQCNLVQSNDSLDEHTTNGKKEHHSSVVAQRGLCPHSKEAIHCCEIGEPPCVDLSSYSTRLLKTTVVETTYSDLSDSYGIEFSHFTGYQPHSEETEFQSKKGEYRTELCVVAE